MRMNVARLAAALYILALYLFLPAIPLLASLMFAKWRFSAEYWRTLRKMLTHIGALRQGPAVHFFHDVLGRVNKVPDDIQGECVQCGNCCMNHQCFFLEKVDVNKFQCGIYQSPFRKLSNCGSFPLNRHDIERYACPSYFVHSGQIRTIHWMPRIEPVSQVTDLTDALDFRSRSLLLSKDSLGRRDKFGH
jgi:uncharacterized cysteine cluster protein YcgN (CxxCxxCC family)